MKICSGRPAALAWTIGSKGYWRGRTSATANLEELRRGTARVLFAFDAWRSNILLVAGDKAGRWKQWDTEAIPLTEQRYETYLKELGTHEDGTP